MVKFNLFTCIFGVFPFTHTRAMILSVWLLVIDKKIKAEEVRYKKEMIEKNFKSRFVFFPFFVKFRFISAYCTQVIRKKKE